MSNYSLFSVMGLEIEYMLVDKETYNVQAKSDLILDAVKDRHFKSLQKDIEISNELVMHVLEFKNAKPVSPTQTLAPSFQQAILDIQPLLLEHNLMLMPTGAHPWMNPHVETVRWPYANKDIYQQYDTIFNCKGHGWSNLQSMHINLPYANDEEFYLLHNAIRLILPLIPALTASTPILDGKKTEFLDSRLHYYEVNQASIPSICGELIPEFIKTENEYQTCILAPMYDAIKPFDPAGILQHPWLNSRGAIPKFDVKAIEIRIVDTQECVTADIAIAKIIFATLKNWCLSSNYYLENPFPTQTLKQVFDKSIRTGLSTPIENKDLFKQWQIPPGAQTIREVWEYLIETNSAALEYAEQQALENILIQGNLSERILKSCRDGLNLNAIKDTYAQLSRCLLSNTLFTS